MARRKKEPPGTHRANIAAAAGRLFAERGAAAVTVDEIAREAGYSKATVYVYFRDREEIVRFLVLESMEGLCSSICGALETEGGTREKYLRICRALETYREQYPYYFESAVGPIPMDFAGGELPPVEQAIFDAGERINEAVADLLRQGMEIGALRRDLDVLPTVFALWAGLSGLIRMAADKQAYIEDVMGRSRREFLDYGYRVLYRSIAAETVDMVETVGTAEAVETAETVKVLETVKEAEMAKAAENPEPPVTARSAVLPETAQEVRRHE